ncbi:hypothetical protein [Halorussus marinus]|uniref:hypothetical protein n=1 Tax=Halorussus marinus TaxID=2505976 RepID=UPI00106E8FBF|nr:hypothetical protein [Halorussus marinus]
MDWSRREVLKAAAATAVTGGWLTARGTGSGVATASSDGREPVANAVRQRVDASLPPGAVLFDLDDDGEYGATVERAAEPVADDAHPRPVRITSDGRETVDYAASVLRPDGAPALGDLDALSYDYYAGPDDGGVPDETFLVVETDSGRHGMYLTYHDGDAGGEWRTHDVLARATGDTGGTSGWFEYTSVEGDADGRTFDDAVERFGPDARIVRFGVGRGDGVDPVALDASYGAAVVGDRTYRFPAAVAQRRAGENPS